MTATNRELLQNFANQHDNDAFATLLQRHGPMVLGTCRRLLRDGHAAEDAFQATFLVLAQKARQIRRPEALGSWLYSVACRIAQRLRKSSASNVQPMTAASTPSSPYSDPITLVVSRELQSALDEELESLP